MIADALPGILRWPELWGLDAREEAILHGMAAIVRLRREADTAHAVRLGMTSQEDYKSRMTAIHREILRISTHRTPDEEYRQNWRDLRAFFGGKGTKK